MLVNIAAPKFDLGQAGTLTCYRLMEVGKGLSLLPIAMPPSIQMTLAISPIYLQDACADPVEAQDAPFHLDKNSANVDPDRVFRPRPPIFIVRSSVLALPGGSQSSRRGLFALCDFGRFQVCGFAGRPGGR